MIQFSIHLSKLKLKETKTRRNPMINNNLVFNLFIRDLYDILATPIYPFGILLGDEEGVANILHKNGVNITLSDMANMAHLLS